MSERVASDSRGERHIDVALDLTQFDSEKLDPSFLTDVASASDSISGVYAVDPHALEIDFGDEISHRALELNQDTARRMSARSFVNLGVDQVIFPEDVPWFNAALDLSAVGIGVAITLPRGARHEDNVTRLRVLMSIMQSAPSAIVSHGEVARGGGWPDLGREVNVLDAVHQAVQNGAILPHRDEPRPLTPRPNVLVKSLAALRECARITRMERERADRLSLTPDSVPPFVNELTLGTSRLGWLAPLSTDLAASDAEVTAHVIDEATRLVPPPATDRWHAPREASALSMISGTVQVVSRVY